MVASPVRCDDTDLDVDFTLMPDVYVRDGVVNVDRGWGDGICVDEDASGDGVRVCVDDGGAKPCGDTAGASISSVVGVPSAPSLDLDFFEPKSHDMVGCEGGGSG